MNDVKTRILEEVDGRLVDLKGLDVGSESYKTGVEGVTQLISAASDLEDREKAKTDCWIDRITKIVNTIAAIAVPVGIALVSMRFERTDTLTTDAGKNALRNCLNFLPKRQ